MATVGFGVQERLGAMILIRSTTVVLLAVLLCVGGVEAARPSYTPPPPPPPPPPAPLPAADAMPSLITRCDDACLLMMSLCSSVYVEEG
jgi:hypothetical protein